MDSQLSQDLAFPESSQFVKILRVPQAFNPHGLKKILGLHTWKNSIIKTKQKSTSNAKQVFVGKGKPLLPGETP